MNQFEFHDVRFNYYGPTLYKDDALRQLEIRLADARNRLAAISDSQSLVSLIRESILGQNFLGELQHDGVQIESNWSHVLQALIDVCTQWLEMIRESLTNHRVLWVLGI